MTYSDVYRVRVARSVSVVHGVHAVWYSVSGATAQFRSPISGPCFPFRDHVLRVAPPCARATRAAVLVAACAVVFTGWSVRSRATGPAHSREGRGTVMSGAARVQGGLSHRFGSAPMAFRDVGALRTAYADRPPWLRQLPAATER